MEDIERERAVWRNILSEELFPKIAPMSSKLLDGDGSLGNINPAKPVNSGVAVKYLQAPFQEKPTNNKRDEIRNKILMEKSRFTSYKEERQIVELLEKPKQKKEEMNKNSNENDQKAKQQQENITEVMNNLCCDL